MVLMLTQPQGDAPVAAKMPHLPQLDGLRACAIILVVLAHAGLEKVVPGGFGVTIFFFLSGYLITTLMRFERMGRGHVDLGAFYLRRAVRILPPLYITLLFAMVLRAGGWLGQPLDASAVFNQAAFLTNYGDLWGPNRGLPLPLWSLAVEEHFYLVFPLLFAAGLGRMSGGRAAALCLVACGVILMLRIVHVATAADFADNYIRTHTRLDSILFGCCLALWNNPLIDRAAFRPKIWHLASAGIVLFACLVIRDEAFRQTLRYTLQGGALFVVFSWCLQVRGMASRLLGAPILGRVALYSYTIYLVHPVLMESTLAQALGLPFVPPLAISLLLTWLYADLMYRLIERPAAALRRRWTESRGAPFAPSLLLRPAP